MTKALNIISLFALLGVQPCIAFSTGAGSCASGEVVSEGHGGLRNGRVEIASSLELTINDKILYHGSINEIDQISNTMTIRSTANDSEFKGFLVRLEKKNSTDIGAVFDSLSTDSKSKDNCDSNVVAMTHTNAGLKGEVEFELEFEPDAEYILDVSVVRKRTEWYYSRLEFVQPTPTTVPSEAPSSAPSVSLSSVPSVAPSTSTSPSRSKGPSAAPSEVPSTKPSKSPSTRPSAYPTVAPSSVPSIIPSTSPSSSPSSSPTTASPTSSPTGSPTASPVSSRTLIAPSASPTSYAIGTPSSNPTPSSSSTRISWNFEIIGIIAVVGFLCI